ncbi:hypothetical protein B0H13DRAFT_1851094 [Mycena leptocephala]|nr:hypothetical protein B0H13DRAFT_1851094 [Mycena leptocephala]
MCLEVYLHQFKLLCRKTDFLYALFLALDANFRLKRKDVSSEEKDPGLGTGLAFFGDVKEYMEHLDKHWDQKQETQRSTCVAHDAVDKPDRESLGTASSGIGTVDCTRHNMKRPNAVGDLQKGERYLNMDYMFFMSLAGSPLQRLYISYDIVCQWHKNIRERMKIFDSEIQFKDGQKYVVFLVPKFHLPTHIELCNILYSFNLTPFVGRTDGEAPERLANSTSISGPGARRDMIDTHFQYWNWKKIIALGRVMLERMQKYVPLMLETRAAWVDMEASFSPAVIEEWMAMAVAWEKDADAPNPFASKINHVNLKAVRRKLAVIASEDIEHLRVRGDMHDTEMLSMGLKLEEEQRKLATHVKNVGAHEMTTDRAGDKAAPQDRRLDDCAAAVHPEVALLWEREDAARKRVAATQVMPGIRAQDMKLWLPSAIGTRAQCDVGLLEYEYELIKTALDEIRDQLLVRTHEYKYKDKSLCGNKAKTRSATRTKAIDARIERASEEYRTAYAVLVSLGAVLKETEWQQHLKVPKPGDVRGRPNPLFGDEERQRGGGRQKKAMDPEEAARRAALQAEGKMAMSWIWLSQGADGEEEDIVHNEDFLNWRGEWWRLRVGLRAALQPEEALREGHSAYAHKQAEIMEGLSASFKRQWADVEGFLELARAEHASMTLDDDEEDAEADEEGPDSSLIGTSVNVSARFRRFCQTDPYTLAVVYDDQLILPYIIDGKAGAVVPKGILLSVIHHGVSLSREILMYHGGSPGRCRPVPSRTTTTTHAACRGHISITDPCYILTGSSLHPSASRPLCGPGNARWSVLACTPRESSGIQRDTAQGLQTRGGGRRRSGTLLAVPLRQRALSSNLVEHHLDGKYEERLCIGGAYMGALCEERRARVWSDGADPMSLSTT